MHKCTGCAAQRLDPAAIDPSCGLDRLDRIVSRYVNRGSWPLDAAAALVALASGHWPQPIVVEDIAGDRGPVLITIEYRIAPDRRDEFLRLMKTLGPSRRRDGAVQWGVAEDITEPGTYHFVGGAPGLPLRQPETPGEKETT